MLRKSLMLIGVVLLVASSRASALPPPGPNWLYCHNGRLLCCDEQKANAHDTHVTQGNIQCVFIAGGLEPGCGI